MSNRPIIVGLAATFVGLTAVLVVSGVLVSPVLLAVAVPFGVAAFLLWSHASGRLFERGGHGNGHVDGMEGSAGRIRQWIERGGGRGGTRRETRRTGSRSWTRPGGGGYRRGDGSDRSSGGDRVHAGDRTRDGGRGGGARTSEFSERAAYATLGLDPSADADEIRAAYRERAKRLHPDNESGDEAAFKRLVEAYDVLTG